MNTNRQLSFRKRLLNAESVQSALDAAQSAQAEFLAGMKDLVPLLYPELEASTLKALIAHEAEPEVISAAVVRINELNGDGAKAAQARAGTLAKGLCATFSRFVETLIRTADTAADDLIADAVQAERDLFDAFNIAPEPTSIADGARNLKRTVRSLTQRAGPSAHLVALNLQRVKTTEHQEVLDWFTKGA